MATHRATSEWQSFEGRMRLRRAERCLLRADAAIEAGCLDEARENIQEVRRLCPSTSELAELEKRLADAQIPVAVDTPGARLYGRATGVLAILVLLAVMAGAGWYTAIRIRSNVRVDPVAAPDRQPREPAAPEPAVIVSSTTQVVVPDPGLEQPIEPESDTAPIAERLSPVGAPTPAIRQIERSDTPAGVLPPFDPPAGPPASATLPAADVPPSASLSTPAPVAALDPAPVPAPPSAPAAASAPAVSEVERVRAVLDRYQSAYTTLDARAAASVYPRLDTRALARAFDGLAAQRVSLGRCDVVVNLMTAQANCAGSASWTPKVGGSSQTSARNWRFELRRIGDNWQIAEAVTR